MYILGIEAATPVAGTAVVKEEKMLAERMVNNLKTHSVNLLPMIKAVIEDAEIKASDLGGIAVSSGPGSFTGLRIGMSTAKTLAHVFDLPVAGISTLDALGYRFVNCSKLVCPLLNARKNEVYTAVYRSGECIEEHMAVDIKTLAGILENYRDGDIIFVGDGVQVYYEQLKEYLGERFSTAPGFSMLPGAAEIAVLGCLYISRGVCTDAFQLLPEYIRLSEAEVKLRKKQGSGVKHG